MRKKSIEPPRYRPPVPLVRGPRNNKGKGELAELAFLYKASGLGFGVAKPYGDNERYDFILDSGERFWRVQVRSTSGIAKGRSCYMSLAAGAIRPILKPIKPGRLTSSLSISFPSTFGMSFPLARSARFTTYGCILPDAGAAGCSSPAGKRGISWCREQM
jgi:hypothetical protein